MLLRPDILIFMIPIVAVVVWGCVQIVKMFIEHRERIAWIEQGLDPDAPHAPLSEDDLSEPEDRPTRTPSPGTRS
jgi:hypothetical protein